MHTEHTIKRVSLLLARLPRLRREYHGRNQVRSMKLYSTPSTMNAFECHYADATPSWCVIAQCRDLPVPHGHHTEQIAPPFLTKIQSPPLYLVSVKRSQTFACSSTAYYCLLGNWPFNHSPRQWITTGSKLAAAPPPAPHEAQRVSWGRVSPLSHLENRHIHRPLAGTLALSCR